MTDTIELFQQVKNDVREIDSIRDMIRIRLKQTNFSEIFTIINGVKAGQKIYWTKGGKQVTTKSTGCKPTFTDYKIRAYEDQFNPQGCEVNIRECYTEFENYFTEWGLGNGLQRADLRASDFSNFIVDHIVESMLRDRLKLFLLSDKDMTSDILTTEDDLGFFNIIDKGLIPTLIQYKADTTFGKNVIDYELNSAADQDKFPSENYVKDLFTKLIRMSDFDRAGGFILTDRASYLNLEDWQKNTWGIQSSKDEVINGIPNLKLDGVPIIAMPLYDEFVKNYFTKTTTTDEETTTKKHLPHFAVYTKKEALKAAFDLYSSSEILELTYLGGPDRNLYFQSKYEADFKINPFLFTAAI